MTNPRNRQHDRAVRAYQRDHPGTSLTEDRKAVAARSGRQQGLPARIPAAPMPRPAERLDDYVPRVAKAVGVQLHRAMELLGLEPGISVTARLNELAAGLPDRTVRTLSAATGMLPAQARSLASPSTRDAISGIDFDEMRNLMADGLALRHSRPEGWGKSSTLIPLTYLARQLLDDKMIRPGGQGKTSTDAPALSRLLAESGGQRPLRMDMDPVRSLEWPCPALSHAVLVDLPWPADDRPLPVAPDAVEVIPKELGITSDPQGK
ncbi:hypothetical protein ACWGI1_27340 [Streptomyces sp. NPDC054835]